MRIDRLPEHNLRVNHRYKPHFFQYGERETILSLLHFANLTCVLQSEGFHPEKSRVNGDALADFIRAQLTGNLEEVCYHTDFLDAVK